MLMISANTPQFGRLFSRPSRQNATRATLVATAAVLGVALPAAAMGQTDAIPAINSDQTREITVHPNGSMDSTLTTFNPDGSFSQKDEATPQSGAFRLPHPGHRNAATLVSGTNSKATILGGTGRDYILSVSGDRMQYVIGNGARPKKKELPFERFEALVAENLSNSSVTMLGGTNNVIFNVKPSVTGSRIVIKPATKDKRVYVNLGGPSNGSGLALSSNWKQNGRTFTNETTGTTVVVQPPKGKNPPIIAYTQSV